MNGWLNAVTSVHGQESPQRFKGSSGLKQNKAEREIEKILKERQVIVIDDFDIKKLPQNQPAQAANAAMMVDIVVASQVKEIDEDEFDHYSHNGNSWNQSDIDDAYDNYYSSMPFFVNDSEEKII